MPIQEHAQTARDFLAKADQHFAENGQIQASEKPWGAAAHAVMMAVAMERGWHHTSHPAMKQAAERLAEEHGDPLIAGKFAVAEKYHFDSCYLFMERWEWITDRPKVRDLVERVLALHSGQNGSAGA